MSIKNIFTLITAASLVWSCGPKESTPSNDFNVATITSNVADNIIIPQLEEFKLATEELASAFNSFSSSPNETTLTTLQTKFKTSYNLWQACSFINYGDVNLSTWQGTINTYPTDTTNIHSIFKNDDANLGAASFADAIGLPGLDYVFFYGTNTEIIDRLSNEAKIYCEKNIDLIKSSATNAYNFWKNNTDGYYADFKTKNEASAGSPFSEFVNGYVQNVEIFKNGQLGFPAGKFTLNTPKPDQSEALYSGISIDLYKTHLNNLKRVYLGENLLGNYGVGLDDYLKELGATRDGNNLHELILSTFTTLEEKANMLDGTMNEAIASQTAITDDLYLKTKELVAYFKVDMTYAIGVDITYIDNDGD